MSTHPLYGELINTDHPTFTENGHAPILGGMGSDYGNTLMNYADEGVAQTRSESGIRSDAAIGNKEVSRDASGNPSAQVMSQRNSPGSFHSTTIQGVNEGGQDYYASESDKQKAIGVGAESAGPGGLSPRTRAFNRGMKSGKASDLLGGG